MYTSLYIYNALHLSSGCKCCVWNSGIYIYLHICRVLPCVAVCYSVLQCVAACCSVLQRVAVCSSALQCVAVYYDG